MDNLQDIIQGIDLDKPWIENIDPKSASLIKQKIEEAGLDEDEKAIAEDWIWQSIIRQTIVELLFSGQIRIAGVRPILEEVDGQVVCKDIEPQFKRA